MKLWMVNIWNPYQCMATLQRSASCFPKPRFSCDSNQDCLGSALSLTGSGRILDLAATQFPDGSAYHQYQPLTRNADVGMLDT